VKVVRAVIDTSIFSGINTVRFVPDCSSSSYRAETDKEEKVWRACLVINMLGMSDVDGETL